MKQAIVVVLALAFLVTTMSMADPPTDPTPSPEPDQIDPIVDEVADAVRLYRGGRGGWFSKKARANNVGEQDLVAFVADWRRKFLTRRKRLDDTVEHDFMACMDPDAYNQFRKATDGMIDDGLAFRRTRGHRDHKYRRHWFEGVLGLDHSQGAMALMNPSEYEVIQDLGKGEAAEIAYLRQRTMRRWGWKRWGATESVEPVDVSLMQYRWGRFTRHKRRA